MKTTFFILLLIVGVSSCCKDEQELVQGSILGGDPRNCANPICGDWFIKIGEDTLRFFEVPEKTDIDLNYENNELEFPLPVKLSWHKYDGDWGQIEDLIKVEEIWKD